MKTNDDLLEQRLRTLRNDLRESLEGNPILISFPVLSKSHDTGDLVVRYYLEKAEAKDHEHAADSPGGRGS